MAPCVGLHARLDRFRLRRQRAALARRVAVATLAGLCALAAPAAAFEPRPAPGRLLLTLRGFVDFVPAAGKPGAVAVVGAAGIDRLNAAFGVHAVTPLFPGETRASKALAGDDLSRYVVLEMDASVDLVSARAAYAGDPAVAAAEFDMMMPVSREPNELGVQWHLESSEGHDAHVTGGWNHSIGSTSVLLAIADTGVDWQHPDLAANIWANTAEVNGTPGLDDDGNGFVDDVRGWDFVTGLGGAWPGEDAAGADNDPRDFNGHGTHVAGIAAAVTDNTVGVAGVGWNCRILALRIGGSVDSEGAEQGVVLMSAAAGAVNYARVKGAAAINCSWGSSNSGGLGAAVSAAVSQGMVVVVAAGNDASTSTSYLSSRGDCFDVAATAPGDTKASFSNFGSWVDVSAPGVDIFSTYFDHSNPGPGQHAYASLQGTSMAAPVVAGLVGLVEASNPALTGTQIKALIQQGCDDIDALNPLFAGQLGAGRVNALKTFSDFYLTVPNDYPNFEKALAASGVGDTLAFRGGDVVTTPWALTRSGRLIQGGWNASFTVRDPIGNPTIVQRMGIGPALEFVSGIDNTCVIDGVAFTGGVARELAIPLPGAFGGGVLCIGASPVLRNCRFEANSAGTQFVFGGGAGGFFSGSSAVLENCTFTSNTGQSGAGLYVHDSTVHMQGGAVVANSSVGTGPNAAGAGVYVNGGTLTLEGVTVSGNLGAQEGGGIYVATGSLDGVRVVCANNPASNNGGNLRVAGGQVTLRGSELRSGTAQLGAGASLGTDATLTLSGVVVAGNQASIVGGGIYAQGAGASLVNVTWHGNRGAGAGGDAVFAGGAPSAWTLRNCLVTNHTSTANAAWTFSGGPAPQLDYNTFFGNGANVQGATLGPNDVVADPLYVDASAGDFALGMHSPALDSGDPAPGAADPDATRNDRGGFGGPDAESRAPAPPPGLEAAVVQGPLRNVLVWDASGEPDVESYVVYRGTSSNFVASAATHIGTVSAPTLTFEDASGTSSSWYRLAAVDASGASSGFTAAIQPAPPTDAPAVPQRFALHQNVPNPFNPATVLRFDLPAAAHVRLEVLDASGRLVRVLTNGHRDAGVHVFTWDGRGAGGRSVASGVYVARLVAGTAQATRKMIMVR
jgi:subtilisin family serine protease